MFVDGQYADGLTVDAFGNVFAATWSGFAAWTPNGEEIFHLQQDWLLPTTNVAFEDPSGNYPNWLYITTASFPPGTTGGGSLYRTQLLPVPEPLTCSPENELLGDLDGDGNVAFADFLVMSANFGNDVDSYADGDVNCDGNVAFDDFLALSANFGQSLAASGEVSVAASVPEPSTSTFGFIALTSLTLIIRRRRF